jgi:hypothetical protein
MEGQAGLAGHHMPAGDTSSDSTGDSSCDEELDQDEDYQANSSGLTHRIATAAPTPPPASATIAPSGDQWCLLAGIRGGGTGMTGGPHQQDLRQIMLHGVLTASIEIKAGAAATGLTEAAGRVTLPPATWQGTTAAAGVTDAGLPGMTHGGNTRHSRALMPIVYTGDPTTEPVAAGTSAAAASPPPTGAAEPDNRPPRVADTQAAAGKPT